jgi:hypothetical protein
MKFVGQIIIFLSFTSFISLLFVDIYEREFSPSSPFETFQLLDSKYKGVTIYMVMNGKK